MASIVANIAKGRFVEFYNNVDTNTPANSAFVVLALATGGDDLATLQDYDTISAMLAGPSNEVTNAGYSRQTITDTGTFAWAPNDTTNTTVLGLNAVTFTTISAGDVWDFIVVAYDPDTTSGTDTTLIPVTITEARISGVAVSHTGGNTAVSWSSGWAQSA